MLTIPRRLFCLLTLLFVFSVITSPAFASDLTVFGPKDFKIKGWHFHFSLRRFKVHDPRKGVIIITKKTPEQRIWSGFVRLNRRVIPLRHFLRSDDLVLKKKVKLRRLNHLFVFLRGIRGACIRIEVQKKGMKPKNHPPTADGQSVVTNEDTPIPIILNGSDPDGDLLTYDMVSEPTRGTLSGSAPNVTYTPNPNFYGYDSCTFKVNDGKVDSNIATVSITINPVNDPPVANDDTYGVDEDNTLEMSVPGVLVNDSDVDDDALSAVLVSDPSSGRITLNADGSFSYIPNANFYGTDSFTYAIGDGNGGDDAATVNLTVNNVNDNPNGLDDTATLDEDSGPNAIDVLANDSYLPDPVETLTIVSITQGGSGTVAITAGGTGITYQPDPNFYGSDSFDYLISDGNGGTDTVTVNVTVSSINDAPSFTKGADQTVEEDSGPQTILGWATGISPGPTDESGQNLAFNVSNDNNSLFSVQPNVDEVTGDLTYTPAPNANGDATVTIVLHDDGGTDNGGQDISAQQDFTITVNRVNDPPVAIDDTGTTDENSVLNVAALGLLDNDTDLDGDTLTLSPATLTTAQGAVVTIFEDGSYNYDPNGQFEALDETESDTDTFTYAVSDDKGGTDTAKVAITVTGVNDPPVAGDDSYSVDEDIELEAAPPGVLTNDSDVEGHTLSAGLKSAPTNGTLTLNGDGSFTYVPNPDFNGQDSFTYTVTDEEGATDTGTVSIAVIAVADIPEDLDFGLDDDEQQGGGGLVGETIRILNGNNVESRSDMAFPSPNSLGLSFEAFYNSRSEISGNLGYGWTHTYDVSLDAAIVIDDVTYIKIVDRRGRAHYFLEESLGVYGGGFKERTHVRVEAGDFVWYRLDGTRYGFSGSGRLNWIEDEKGNPLELSYDGQNRLDKVTDLASQRTLTFHYYTGGLLEWIEGPTTAVVPDGRWVTFRYDGNKNLISVTYADGSGFNHFYEDSVDLHNLTRKENKAGHLIKTWIYDMQDRVISSFSVQSKGTSNIAYVSENQVDVTDAYGELRTYTLQDIDGRKRVTAMQGLSNAPYSDSNVVRWVYDAEMRLIETESPGGTITQYQNYDGRGNPGTVIFAQGTIDERVITYTYHPDMNLPLTRTDASVLSAAGNKITTWDYDNDDDFTPNENPTSLINRIVEQGFTKDSSGAIVAFEYVTAFTYNSKGQVMSIHGPLPGTTDTTSFAYDETTANLLSMKQPLIGETEFSDYDAAGQVGKITDVNGLSKQFSYDAKGRIAEIKNIPKEGDASSTTINYNNAGLLDSMTDEDGVTGTFDYDGTYGRLATITDTLGNYIAYAYDAHGNRTEMSKHDPTNKPTSLKSWNYQHPDMPGKLWQEINADRPPTVYGYDSEGNVESVRDPNGNTTYYIYDALNRLVEVEQPGEAITEYTYDQHGNLTSVTDAENHTTTYEYDDMGRVVSTSSPDTGTVTYVYDEAGNPVKKKDAKGITVSYTYDVLNRLTTAEFPDPTQNISYSYDVGTNGKGRRTGMTDPSGNTTFHYDARGRLIGKTSTINGIDFTLNNNFTPGNRVSSVSYPSGRTIDIIRNILGRMEDASTTYNGDTIALVTNMSYRPFGGPLGMSTGSGGIVSNESGECDCIEKANPSTDKERIYTYDYNGNLKSIRGTNTPWYNQDFSYDDLSRLVSGTGRYGTLNYTYDNVGNRLTRELNGETETYEYFTGTNKLKEIKGFSPITLSYDANGNTTGIGNKVLVYNQKNRLIRVEADNDILAEYTYNGLGQRVMKKLDGAITLFHYDLNGNLIAESDANGNMTAEYLYVGKIRVAMVDISTGDIYYYLNSKLGVPQLMTDDTGTVAWEAMHKPFGEAEINPKSSLINNFRFPGQYYDEETGLHYNYHRYYDPSTGRYLSPDPLDFGNVQPARQNPLTAFPALFLHEYGVSNPQVLNLYTYVQNNPIISIDPFGLLSIRGALKNPRVKSIISLGAAKLAEYASTKMGPGKARGAVYAISGILAFASAFEATKAAVASYVAAATTAPTVAGAIVGYSMGTLFAGIAVYDLFLASEYFEKAYRDFFNKVPVGTNPCD